MKKLVSLVLALSMMLTMVAFSATAETTDEPVTLTILSLKNESAPQEAFNEMFENFSKQYPNVTFEMQSMTSDELKTTLRARIASGDVPDIVTWMKEIDASYLYDLTGQEFLNNLNSETVAGANAIYSEGTYAMPIDNGYIGMFYNKDVLAASGITEVPTTWDAFLADCEAIKANGISPVYYSGVDTWTLQFFALMGWYSDYAPEDAQAFADAMSTNQKHWSDMNGFIDSIGKIKELVDLGYVQETYLSDTYQQAQQALLDGTCAFYAQGDWVVGELEKIDADKTASSIGAFLIPLADHLYCGVGVNKGFYVSKNGKNPELAQKVMEALVSPEAQQAYFDAQSGIPVANGVTADLKGPYADIKNILDTADLSPQWTDFCKYSKGPLETYISEVLVGTKTPADVAAALDADFAKAAIDAGDPNWN